MKIQTVPARIWGFVASEAPRIVLLRRRPSRWTQMWLWNTETDEFEAGNWLAMHVYYHGCDLSPDGEYFIYYAANESKRKREVALQKFGVDYLTEWTVLCKPPHFNSCGTWWQSACLGGGDFRDKNHLALTASAAELVLLSADLIITRDMSDHSFPFILGMQRTGWEGFDQQSWIELRTGSVKKGLLRFDWQDESSFSVSNVPKYTYTYPDADLAGVSWADLDQQGHLVYARHGCVYRHTDAGEQLLADLNASQPPRPWLNAKPQDKEKTAPKGGSLTQ